MFYYLLSILALAMTTTIRLIQQPSSRRYGGGNISTCESISLFDKINFILPVRWWGNTNILSRLNFYCIYLYEWEPDNSRWLQSLVCVCVCVRARALCGKRLNPLALRDLCNVKRVSKLARERSKFWIWYLRGRFLFYFIFTLPD